MSLWDDEDPLEMPILKEALISIGHLSSEVLCSTSLFFCIADSVPAKQCDKYVFSILLKYLSGHT